MQGMKKQHLLFWVPILLLALALPHPAESKNDEPDVVVVQHILIAFKKSLPNKKLDRTKKEAQALALELLERAGAGEDFDALVKEYTNDRHPGIYKLTNKGAPLMSGARSREDMVPNFGRISFSLEVGEIGMAKYHPGNSPFGWHIIKRLE
jgi:parvulin-like peptidyl-prolyl isomerase